MKFPAVFDGRNRHYGGNQSWFGSRLLRKSGCGVIACANLAMSLKKKTAGEIVRRRDYMETAQQLRKNMLVLPHFGLSGPLLQLGLNRYFKRQKLAYRAGWGTLPKNLEGEIRRMLALQIPVILLVASPFPAVFRKNQGVMLYWEKGNLQSGAERIRGHFVTVTEQDGDWLTVSSWGRKYYIRLSEYLDYMKRQSFPLFSNILRIRSLQK